MKIPNNHESEAALLGKIFFAPERMADIGPQLTIDDFYNLKHRMLWRAFLELHKQDIEVDAVTVWGWLEERQPPSGLNPGYIGKLHMGECTAADIETHVRILHAFTAQRKVAAFAKRIAEQAQHPQDDIAAFLTRTTEEMINIASASVTGQPAAIGDEIDAVVTHAMSADPEELVRVPTGIGKLDYTTGGLLNQQLNLVIARPSMGKTTFMANVALGLARRGPVLWFSFEESLTQLQYILISNLCGVPYDSMQRGGQLDAAGIAKSAHYIKGLPIYIETTRMPFESIMQRCMSFRGRYGELSGIIIDHIGLIPYTGKSTGFRQTFEMIRGLSSIPGRCQCPLLAAHQMNRGVKDRADRRPTLTDMRDAGEEDAKQVWGLYRPITADEEADPRELEIHVLKNKGRIGRISVDCDIACARIDKKE